MPDSQTPAAAVTTEPKTDTAALPAPSLQPSSGPPVDGVPRFSSTEVLWWNNGIWGDAGYAMPNPVGKIATKNALVHELHTFIGRELFSLLHQPDVRFRRPPNAEWLHSVAKMVKLGRKRMGDVAIGWNDERMGDAKNTTNNAREFLVYPIPFFGGRVRNEKAHKWADICLVLLSEIMQHADNDLDADITTFLASTVDTQLLRIQYEIATYYLGIDRATASADGFVLPAITEATYHPDELFTEAEMDDERPPVYWWPTNADLTPIKGVPASLAFEYAMRWPISGEGFYGDQGAVETAFPGTLVGKTVRPGSRAAEQS